MPVVVGGRHHHFSSRISEEKSQLTRAARAQRRRCNALQGLISMSARPRFAAAIRKALAERQETTVDLANALGIPSSTLRTWLNRQRFPQEQAVAISTYLGWNLSATELEQRYDVGRWATIGRATTAESRSLGQLFQEHDKAAARVSELTLNSPPALEMLFEAMQAGDLYVHIAATTFPLESLPDSFALREAIGRAVARGAFFLYIVPDDGLYRKWLDFFSVRCGTDGSFLRAYVDPLRTEIERQLVKEGSSEPEAQRRAQKQMHVLTSDGFPWFAPTCSYSVIASLYPVVREPLLRAWMTLPGDPRNRLLLPHSDQFALRLVTAAFRLSLGRLSCQGDIAIFDYLMEFPGHWAF